MWRASGNSKVASLFCLLSIGLFRHFSLASRHSQLARLQGIRGKGFQEDGAHCSARRQQRFKDKNLRAPAK